MKSLPILSHDQGRILWIMFDLSSSLSPVTPYFLLPSELIWISFASPSLCSHHTNGLHVNTTANTNHTKILLSLFPSQDGNLEKIFSFPLFQKRAEREGFPPACSFPKCPRSWESGWAKVRSWEPGTQSWSPLEVAGTEFLESALLSHTACISRELAFGTSVGSWTKVIWWEMRTS